MSSDAQYSDRGMMMMMMMMMMMIMVMVITIIIITFKGATQDFYNVLAAPQTVSNAYVQVARAQSCANHVQHHRAPITCNMCYVPHGMKGQLSY